MTPTTIDQTKSNIIHVVYACDAGYALPTIVSIASLLKNKKADTDIQIYIIATRNTFARMAPTLDSLCEHYCTAVPKPLEPLNSYDNSPVTVAHLTRTMYYRLDIPRLLPDIDKCIYLDGDTIVLDDITGLYSAIANDDYIAGVKAAAYYYPEQSQQAKADQLLINEFTDYINSGVLVMNINAIRQEGVVDKWDGLLKFRLSGHDQDILNSACHNRITLLHPKFNLMTKYHPANQDSYTEIPSINICWTQEDWREACITPVVIHYADRVKPWQNTSADFSDLWWEYAELAESLTSFAHGFLPVLRSAADSAAATAREYEGKRESLEKQLEKKEHDCQTLQAQKNSLAEEKTSLTKEKSTLTKEKESLTKERAILAKERDSLLSDNKKLQEKRSSLEKRIETLDEKLVKSREQTNRAKRKLDEIHASRSWKVGRAITLIPRKIKRLVKH